MTRLTRSPVMLAGFSFLLFSPLELALGYLTHNTAIAANASHDAFDGVFFLVFGWVMAGLARSKDHRYYCRGRGILAIVIALLAVAFVGIGILFDRGSGDGLGQMIAALTLGPASFGLNLFWHRRLDPHDREEGFGVHLLGDMIGSAIVFVCGPIAYLAAVPGANFWGGILTLAIVTIIAAMRAAAILRAIWHRAVDHTHQSEQALEEAFH